MMRVKDIAVAEPEGVPKKYVRKKPRKCKYCGKVLTIYNENKYCFAHVRMGWKDELENAEKRKKQAYKKNLAKKKKETMERKLARKRKKDGK